MVTKRLLKHKDNINGRIDHSFLYLFRNGEGNLPKKQALIPINLIGQKSFPYTKGSGT